MLLIACTQSSSNKNYNFNVIENELDGSIINDSIDFNKRQFITEESKTVIFYNTSNKKVKEIDIYINTKLDSTFPILLNYYNQKFNTTKNDSIYNSWLTDSSEFNLYKKSDSSILVNIFKRTYL